MIKYLEIEKLEYVMVKEFLADLKKEFGGEDDEIIKIAELKKIEQENRTMEAVQEFRRAVRGSGYERREMNEVIQ